MIAVLDTFTWSGQPVSAWPAWMIFRNYAADAEKIVIHTLWGRLVVALGNTVELLSTQEVRLTSN